MRPSDVRPTGVERTFRDDEIIVTKTDLKGVITYANDVFLRVSAYPEDAVVGKPHNVIRHPDMPRGIFQLVWDTLADRRELFAYVVNLAGDGAHYWVFAHITPTVTARGEVVGYHSSRRTPDRGALEQIRRLYDAMLAEERRHARPVDAIAASTALLERELEQRGVDYDEFVWSLTTAGVRA